MTYVWTTDGNPKEFGYCPYCGKPGWRPYLGGRDNRFVCIDNHVYRKGEEMACSMKTDCECVRCRADKAIRSTKHLPDCMCVQCNPEFSASFPLTPSPVERLDKTQAACRITNLIEVFAVGSWVTIADDIAARVQQVCVSGKGVTYECVWWDGRVRYEKWLCDFEVRPHDKSTYSSISFTPCP